MTLIRLKREDLETWTVCNFVLAVGCSSVHVLHENVYMERSRHLTIMKLGIRLDHQYWDKRAIVQWCPRTNPTGLVREAIQGPVGARRASSP